MRWQLQVAKQRLSEVVRRARDEGPQIVTRHGVDMVVIVDVAAFHQMCGTTSDFKDFLRSAPETGSLELDRSSDPAPTVDLSVEP